MKKNDLIINILLIFSIITSFLGLLTDASNTIKYGGVDLRNKVVGARLLKKDLDPYFYKWQSDDPVELLDPRDKEQNEVNMVTVPPSVLMLFYPFTSIRYNIQRTIWLILQWIMLLVSIWLFTKTTKDHVQRKMIWLISLFFIASSFFWRLHVERGQIYILYVLLLALAYYSLRYKIGDLICGFILGIAVALRLPMIILPVIFLFFRKWKILASTIAGSIFVIAINLFILGNGVWFSYFRAMQIHGSIHLEERIFGSTPYPYANIEGIANLYALANIPINNTSIQHLLSSLGWKVPGNYLLFGFMILFIISLSFFKRKCGNCSIQMLFFLGSIFLFIADFFLPAARFSYNNVMILPIISIAILKKEDIVNLFDLKPKNT